MNSNGVVTFKNRARDAYLSDIGGVTATSTTNSTNRTRWTLQSVTSASKGVIEDLIKDNAEVIEQFFAFPNPSANGIFQLSRSETWSVYNLNGQLVLNGSGTSVDLSSRPHGVYVLKTANQILRLV